MVRRTSSRPKVSSNSRRNGPRAQEALLSLALPSSSAERPSKSRRFTSLASVAPTIRRCEDDGQRHLGLRIVPVRFRVEPGVRAAAHRGHRLRLGEDLGVRTDPDLEILAPGALRDQHLLQRHRLGRAGLEPAQVVADQALDLRADRRRGGEIAPGALLDHALQHRGREGDARPPSAPGGPPGRGARAVPGRGRPAGVLARIASRLPRSAPSARAQSRGGVAASRTGR